MWQHLTPPYTHQGGKCVLWDCVLCACVMMYKLPTLTPSCLAGRELEKQLLGKAAAAASHQKWNQLCCQNNYLSLKM